MRECLSFSALLFVALVLWASSVRAEFVVVDRAVARFSVPELGGLKAPQFVFERVLAFEARLEALSDSERNLSFRERHVRVALERHVAETILASLRIDPEPSAAMLEAQIASAKGHFAARVGGADRIDEAARIEGLSELEVARLIRRTARASLYLDRMVVPLLTSTDVELRELQRRLQPPLRSAPFESVRPLLQREYVARRLSAALASYFDSLRSRLNLLIIEPFPIREAD